MTASGTPVDARPIIGITHDEAGLARHFADADVARLRAAGAVRLLGETSAPSPRLADVELLVGSWGMPTLDAALLAAAPRLRAVCYAAGSVKRFATAASYARGIAITSAWQANAIPVAEVTAALIVLADKGWFPAQDAIRRQGAGAYAALRRDGHVGNLGAVVGLVGFGAIGRLVAERLRPLELRVLAYDPHAPAAAMAALGVERVDELVALARVSDVVSLHAANVPATVGMIDARVLAAMRDGAWLINTARGQLVDEAALIAELERGRLYACLDVTAHEPPADGSPLYRLANVWLTPHRAGSSSRELHRMGRWAVDDCLALLAGAPPRWPVTEAMLATMA